MQPADVDVARFEGFTWSFGANKYLSVSTSTSRVAAGYDQEMEEYEEVSVLVRSDAPWRIGGFGSCVGLLDDPTRLVVARLHPRPRTRPGLRLRPPQ